MTLHLVYVRAVDANGAAYPGAKLYTYVAGTTTPQVSYQDALAATAHNNPVVCDANGAAVVYLDDALSNYKLLLTDSAGSVTLFSEDDVDPATFGGIVVTSVQVTVGELTNSFVSGTQATIDLTTPDAGVIGLKTDTGVPFFGDAARAGGIEIAPMGAFGPLYDVEKFGAVGDGTTDDGAAIQAAIDALPSTGGTVFFGPNTYATERKLNISNKSFVRLKGQGHNQDVFNAFSAGTRILYTGTALADGVVEVTPTSTPIHGVEISDLLIDANGLADQALILTSSLSGRFANLGVANARVDNLLMRCLETAVGTGCQDNMFWNLLVSCLESNTGNTAGTGANGITFEGPPLGGVNLNTSLNFFFNIFGRLRGGRWLNFINADSNRIFGTRMFMESAYNGTGIYAFFGEATARTGTASILKYARSNQIFSGHVGSSNAPKIVAQGSVPDATDTKPSQENMVHFNLDGVSGFTDIEKGVYATLHIDSPRFSHGKPFAEIIAGTGTTIKSATNSLNAAEAKALAVAQALNPANTRLDSPCFLYANNGRILYLADADEVVRIGFSAGRLLFNQVEGTGGFDFDKPLRSTQIEAQDGIYSSPGGGAVTAATAAGELGECAAYLYALNNKQLILANATAGFRVFVDNSTGNLTINREDGTGYMLLNGFKFGAVSLDISGNEAISSSREFKANDLQINGVSVAENAQAGSITAAGTTDTIFDVSTFVTSGNKGWYETMVWRSSLAEQVTIRAHFDAGAITAAVAYGAVGGLGVSVSGTDLQVTGLTTSAQYFYQTVRVAAA